jgi:hypothetical protein
LTASIDHRALQDLDWMSQQGTPYDSPRLRLQLIKSTYFLERALPREPQSVLLSGSAKASDKHAGGEGGPLRSCSNHVLISPAIANPKEKVSESAGDNCEDSLPVGVLR